MGIFLIFWFCFAAIQLCYWGIVFQAIAWYKAPKSPQKSSFPAVSIVICARNEAVNLQKNLESILTQDYPNYEVLLVNDDSEDETVEVLATFQQQYAHLKVITIKKKEIVGKKGALTAGIAAAAHDWILLTDADCRASSKHWISEMQHCAEQANSAIVLGYGPCEKGQTWLNRWVQFETIYVAIQYFSFALWKQPFMGVGRNLMYKKALFYKNRGFEDHKHLASGDDDLFVNAIAKGDNTTICLNPAAFMYSPNPESWKKLYRQKTRHYSSSSHYKLKHKILLGLLSLSHFCFYIGVFFFIVINIWNCGILVILILRTFLLYMVFVNYLNRIKNSRLLAYILVLDVLLPVYYVVFAFSLIGQQQTKWK